MAGRGSGSKDPQADKDHRKKSPRGAGPDHAAMSKGPRYIVGIGASAGGLEALRALLPSLPVDAGNCYIIAQHLSPDYPSMLTSLLGRSTTMPVVQIEDNQPLLPNHVFITPPGRDVVVRDGCLRLAQTGSAIGPKPSVDYLLSSLAEEYAERAVGIILSGTGSDGAHGIRAIKAGGGLTMAQSEDSAKFNGMPHAALLTGLIDLVLPPEKMGYELKSVLEHPRSDTEVSAEKDNAATLETLYQLILDRTGCDFFNYKPSTILRRIGRRLDLLRLDSLENYIAYIRNNPDELVLLKKEILISVTSFFRDKEAFAALREALAELLERKKAGDNVRIWVPGCATGEEAYSIAILIHDLLQGQTRRYNIQIFATDLDEEAIEVARRGLYPEATLVDMDPRLRESCFQPQGSRYQVIDAVRDLLIFAQQDLVRDPPYSRLDLISCRNVLIYFNAVLQEQILRTFHYALQPEGLLFLGKSESIGRFGDLFSCLHRKVKIFARLGSPRTGPRDFQMPIPRLSSAVRTSTARPDKDYSPRLLLQESLLKQTGLSGVLVNAAFDILFVHGDVNPFLGLSEGRAGLNLLDLARPDLRLDLRTSLHIAAREQRPVQSRLIPLEGSENKELVRILVVPVSGKSVPDGLLAVGFEKRTSRSEAVPEPDTPEWDRKQLVELEQEILAYRERLQTTMEELETANEELQSTNEELQSTIEELQSSNEELEASNEELQSTNEELLTVNDELQTRTQELAQANADLENILRSLLTPLVIFDDRHVLVRFNDSAAELFALTRDHLGQPLAAIPGLKAVPGLAQDVTQVLASAKPSEKELAWDGRLLLFRCQPYRTADGQVSGVLATFPDLADRLYRRRDRAIKAVADRLIDHGKGLDDVLTTLMPVIVSELEVPVALFCRPDGDGRILHHGKVAEQDWVGGVAVERDQSLAFLIMATEETIGDIERLPGRKKLSLPGLAGEQLRAFMGVPVRVHGQVAGSLIVADTRDRPDLRVHLRLVEDLAQQLARVMERS